ncbi:tetratricopeptide repeat-containing glycosyltransferase family 2 protein [Oceanobacillus kapialis]|uniref:Glycosyltransferase n=1 Tax=Oceanobacillus kapialis TaxID=481353 RepID=A0ABW5Q1M2_9BACI
MRTILSVCIIMKNEESVIARCLESIKDVADEIIIVDTGSTDQSKEIARRYTDKLFDFEWVNDFSKARNFAATKATGDWIFVIDADEYVETEAFAKLRSKFIDTSLEQNIMAVQIVSFVGENGKGTSLNYHERLYKNDGTIAYHRNIHELLIHEESKEKRDFLDFQIYHSGYMKDVMSEKDKFNRNLSLLLEKDEKEPLDYFFIGNEYRNGGEVNKAILYYQKAYKLSESIHLDWVKKLLLNLTDSLHVVNRDDEAFEIIDSCEKIYYNLVDFKFYRAIIYFDSGDYKRSKSVFKEILAQKGNLLSESSIDFMEFLPLRYLGEIYENEMDYHNAVKCYSQALAINSNDDTLWVKMITLLAKHSQLSELVDFLNNNLMSKDNITPQRVVKILLSVPILDVQKLSRSFIDETGLSAIENESLLIKNFHLDNNISSVSNLLSEKTSNDLIPILATGIFSLIDLILFVMQKNNHRYQELLLNINYDQPLDSLLGMLFNKKNKKMSPIEENFYLSVYKQASILGDEPVLGILNGKKQFLSKKNKIELAKYRTSLKS